MSSAEAREKGIDAVMGEDKYSRVVFEAKLKLDAVAFLIDIEPKTRIKIGIESSGTETPNKSHARSPGGKGGGRKGGRGGRGSEKPKNSFKTELDVTLANASR